MLTQEELDRFRAYGNEWPREKDGNSEYARGRYIVMQLFQHLDEITAIETRGGLMAEQLATIERQKEEIAALKKGTAEDINWLVAEIVNKRQDNHRLRQQNPDGSNILVARIETAREIFLRPFLNSKLDVDEQVRLAAAAFLKEQLGVKE